MRSPDLLRRGLLELLTMGSAHIDLDGALEGLELPDAFRRPSARGSSDDGLHSVWELLEHMRIAQEDIIRYTLDPSWVSPPWPNGYWPEILQDSEGADLEGRWRHTLTRFREDLESVRALVRDERIDLASEIPHGEGRTYIRQVLLVADHNAYHLGQIVTTRRSLGAWK